MTRQCQVEPSDTLDTLYKRFLYPQGIEAMAEAVDLIAAGKAPKIKQTEEGATYDPAMFKEENQRINLAQSAERIFNFVRALDSVPGAVAYVENPEHDDEPELIRLFGATLTNDRPNKGIPLKFIGLKSDAIVHSGGILITGTDGLFVNIQRVKKGSRMIDAGKWFEQNAKKVTIELTEVEKQMIAPLRNIWESILKVSVTDETDFFACGAGSMDVVRLIEEVKDAFEVSIENELLFMAPVFLEFLYEVIKASRGGDSRGNNVTVKYDGFVLNENKRKISIATQLFINGKFVNAENGATLSIINPTTEKVICHVAAGSANDVNDAVEAAHAAFHGEWSQLSARQKGALMFKLADLMELHKEELATIEAADSGAVYTLALKTHIGMSIDAWRYFAGWTDKIHGSTIPVSAARPNKVLTFTKREPIG